MLKAELAERLEKLEQELHEERNSSEYWSVEYHRLLKLYNEAKENDLLQDINNCSIVQERKIRAFIEKALKE